MEDMLARLYQEYHTLINTYHTTVDKLNKISEAIKSYGGEAPNTSELNESNIANVIANVRESLFPQNGTWAEKIMYALKRLNKPVTANEIFGFLRKTQPLLFEGHLLDNYSNTIAATCSRLAKEKEIAVDTSGSVNKYYIQS